jgi:hypothetical protein
MWKMYGKVGKKDVTGRCVVRRVFLREARFPSWEKCVFHLFPARFPGFLTFSSMFSKVFPWVFPEFSNFSKLFHSFPKDTRIPASTKRVTLLPL